MNLLKYKRPAVLKWRWGWEKRDSLQLFVYAALDGLQFFAGNGLGSQNGNQETSTIPMQLFPDRDENEVNNHEVATPPQTGNQDIEKATLDKKDDTTVDLLEYDVITADETDGGAGSKMVMGERSYLGNIQSIAITSDMQI